MSETFRVYTSPDMLGIELGAALKNVVALAAGIADGLGYGDNTKAALITRGMAEISRLGIAMGGKIETFYGLSGIGDLIVTCASVHSRNRRAGISDRPGLHHAGGHGSGENGGGRRVFRQGSQRAGRKI